MDEQTTQSTNKKCHHGTLYIYFREITISILVGSLYRNGEEYTGDEREVYHRGLAYFKGKGIPVETLEGYEEQNFSIQYSKSGGK